MKKIFILFLAICMLISTYPTVYAANNLPVNSTEAELNKAQIVEILKIMPVVEDDSLPVSRGEFVSYITKILFGSTQIAEGIEKNYFGDVNSTHPYAGAIYNAVEIGLINGNGNGKFNPDEPILWSQAVKILITALGYSAQAERSGGYPTGYINIAGRRNLLKNLSISGEAELSLKDCKILLYRAITIPYAKLKSISGSSSEFEISEDGTWLLDYLNIRTETGIVTETGISSLLRKSRIEKNQIRIEDKLFEDPNMLGQELLGYDVVAFVENEENGEVKLIMPEYNQNKSLVIDARDLVTADSDYGMDTIIYRDYRGKKQRVTLSKDADFIFNGVAYANCEDDDLKITSGSITLIDSDGGSDYSIVLINSCETYVVNNVTTEEKAIYDKYSSKMVALVPDNPDVQYRIIDIDGNEISIDEIHANDVISVYESKDGSFVKIMCSGPTLTGKITSIQKEDKILYIDEEPYEICSSHSVRILDQVTLGKSYTFWLNDKKEIAEYSEVEAIDANTAYLIRTEFYKKGRLDILELKMYNFAGEHLWATCKEEIYLDSVKVKVNQESKDEGVFDRLLAADTVIEYKLNESGEITSIDLPYVSQPGSKESEDSLRVLGNETSQKLQYRRGPNLFLKGGLVFMDSNTKCLQIPSDLEDEGEYIIKSSSDFTNTYSYTIKAFGRGSENFYSKYVLVYDFVQQTTSDRPFIVSEKRVKINEDEEEVEQLNGYNSGEAATLISRSPGILSGFNEGDLLMPLSGANGEIISAKMVFDAETKTISSDYVKDIYSGSHAAVITKVYNKNGDFIEVTNDAEINDDTVPVNTYRLSNCDVYIYDSLEIKGNKLRLAGKDDILDYTHNNAPSTVMVYAVSFVPYIVIILR